MREKQPVHPGCRGKRTLQPHALLSRSATHFSHGPALVCNGIVLIQRVLAQRSIGFLRRHTHERTVGDHWRLMQQAYTSGLTLDEASGKVVMTIEATLRHIYFEETTHLYNIQRLKRAQGLSTIVTVPRVGYWVLDGWDRSEPFSDGERVEWNSR